VQAFLGCWGDRPGRSWRRRHRRRRYHFDGRACGRRHRVEPGLRVRMHDRMLPGALDLDLNIAPFQLELGNVLLDEELDEFFQLFLIHSFTVGPFVCPRRAPEGRAK